MLNLEIAFASSKKNLQTTQKKQRKAIILI